jgi:nitrate/TMAO reductase-like tetraheme cytochrome c subunit
MSKVLVFALIALGVVVGVGGVAGTTWLVNATSSTNFCATACHSMQWAAAAYERGPHYTTSYGVRAGCADCHIPYEDRPATPLQYVFGTLWTKGIDGSHDIYAKLIGTISDRARWEANRPRLTAEAEAFFRSTNSVTCQGCHKLDAFSPTGRSAFMANAVHSGLINAATVDCLKCHSGVGHRY